MPDRIKYTAPFGTHITCGHCGVSSRVWHFLNGGDYLSFCCDLCWTKLSADDRFMSTYLRGQNLELE